MAPQDRAGRFPIEPFERYQLPENPIANRGWLSRLQQGI